MTITDPIHLTRDTADPDRSADTGTALASGDGIRSAVDPAAPDGAASRGGPRSAEPATPEGPQDNDVTAPLADSGPDPAQVVTGIGELLAVDPRILVVGVNVRRDLALDKPFLRSIADRGVREPIIARRGADGGLVVRKGKRRTVAAVEVGRDLVPVLVEPGLPDTDTDAPEGLDKAGRAARIERIVDQLEENQHRTGTSEADEVHAHQQLLDLGLTAGQIARRTHVPTARVGVHPQRDHRHRLAIAYADMRPQLARTPHGKHSRRSETASRGRGPDHRTFGWPHGRREPNATTAVNSENAAGSSRAWFVGAERAGDTAARYGRS